MEPEQQTQKQQITELLRQANSLVITSSKSPSIDQTAAVLALTQMLERMGKRVEAVISSDVPHYLNFLATKLLHKKYHGVRDFVIELDTSKTEADKLKYVPEEGRLKVVITPYNGNFSKDDLGYSYGAYHCDGVVALGAQGIDDLDPALSDQKQLLSKVRLITINTAGNPAGGNTVDWVEPQASSLSEMLMSLTEALQPGLLDEQIATSLLTGIIAATNHFSGAGTTPKVMTMAAQLMAGGADQALIVKNLGAHLGMTESADKTAKPKSDNELSPAVEKELTHHEKKQKPDQDKHQPKTKEPVHSPLGSKDEGHPSQAAPPVTPPQFQPPAPTVHPQSPLPSASPEIKPPTPPPAAPPAGGQITPPPSPDGKPATPHLDIEAARRAVEEATRELPNPPPPPSGGQVVPPPMPPSPPLPPPPTAPGA